MGLQNWLLIAVCGGLGFGIVWTVMNSCDQDKEG
jgi:hypothetical protein